VFAGNWFGRLLVGMGIGLALEGGYRYLRLSGTAVVRMARPSYSCGFEVTMC